MMRCDAFQHLTLKPTAHTLNNCYTGKYNLIRLQTITLKNEQKNRHLQRACMPTSSLFHAAMPVIVAMAIS